MSQQNTPTQIIEMIQKMNIPSYLQTKLNEYIGVYDNLKQRIININTSLNDYKNKVNQYNNMDKRKKETKQLLNELKQTQLVINNEKQAIQNDKETLKNNLLLLIDDINKYNNKLLNDIKNKSEIFKRRREAKQQYKNELKNVLNDIQEEIRNREIRKNLFEDIQNELEEHPDAFEELTETDNETIKAIKNHNFEKDPLYVSFKKSGKRASFYNIRDEIYNKIKEFQQIGELYFELFYYVNGKIVRSSTYSLNNEKCQMIMNNILKGGRFDLITHLEEDDHDPSGANQDGINEITFDMISALQFRIPSITLDKKNINKIYCDNGGSFYKYKINKTFENCIPLRIKLLRYQITNELNEDMINKKFKDCELLKEKLLRCKNMFKYNCITWALKMSCKFNETTIENIASFSYHRYVSHKELQEFGDKFNIAFKVLKYRKDKND